MLRIATWTLYQFFRGQSPPPFVQVRLALPVLGKLIDLVDEEVLANACWALYYLSDGKNDRIQSLVEAGVWPRLMMLLSHRSSIVLEPALRTVGNIIFTGDDAQIQFGIDNQVLRRLHKIITQNDEKSIQREVCWMISNITSGNRAQIQAVIEAEIFLPLVEHLHSAEFEIKEKAARAISNATSRGSPEQIRFLVNQGCINPLCDLLICPDPIIITVCLNSLENILDLGEADKENGLNGRINIYAQMIDDCEGLDNIKNLEDHEDNEIYEKVVKLLNKYWSEEDEDQNLVDGVDGNEQVSSFGNSQQNGPQLFPIDPCHSPASVQEMLASIPLMVQGVWSDDPNVQVEATTQFRNLMSIKQSPNPIDELIRAGATPRFVEFLDRQDLPELQFEATWALNIIMSGSSDLTRVVVEHGAVPLFLQLLSSSSEDVQEEAIRALGNIAGNSPSFRDLVLGHGALRPLLTQLNDHSDLSMLRTATWTLSQFFRGQPPPSFVQVRPALPVIIQLIGLNDEDVLANACWALYYLSDGKNDRIQSMVEAGVWPELVKLLLHPSPTVLDCALLTVENIMFTDDAQIEFLLDNQFLRCLHKILNQSHEKSIQREVCRMISNITLGNRAQIQAVIEAEIFIPLVGVLQLAGFQVKKFAAWAIINATNGGTQGQIRLLVNQGCIKPLCDLLIFPDPRIITACLEGLENILQVGEEDKENGLNARINIYAQMVDDCEGLDKIKNLRSTHVHNIYINKTAVYIMRYWAEEVEDQNLFDVADRNQQGSSGFDNSQPNAPAGGFFFFSLTFIFVFFLKVGLALLKNQFTGRHHPQGCSKGDY